MSVRSRPDRSFLRRALLNRARVLHHARLGSAQAPGTERACGSGPAGEAGITRSHWRRMGSGAFRRRSGTKRLVFLDITAVWCHACHVIGRNVLLDSGRHPDSEQRVHPDRAVGARPPSRARPATSRVAGPRTAILSPEGHRPGRANLPPGWPGQADARGSSRSLTGRNKVNGSEDRGRGARMSRRLEDAHRSIRQRSCSRRNWSTDGRLLKESRGQRARGIRGEPRSTAPTRFASLAPVDGPKGSGLRDMAVHAVDGVILLQDSVWGGLLPLRGRGGLGPSALREVLDVNARAIESCLEVSRAIGRKEIPRCGPKGGALRNPVALG